MLRRSSIVAAASCLVSLALLVGWSVAQEEKKGTESKSGDKAETKGRLPIYFGQIGLSKKQEDDVRKVAQPFDDKVAQLRKQVHDLEKQIAEQEEAKTGACEKLLTDGQKIALKERRAQADTEKADRASKKKTAKTPANGNEKKPEEKKPE